MKRIVTFFCVATLLVAVAAAATIENPYFTLTTPDDSWQVDDDGGALSRMGARAMISRSDARRAAIDLARVDFLEIPFTPESYLRSQVELRRDIFCKGATEMSAPADTVLLGRRAVRVHFSKQANGYTYRCTAMAATVGFGTLFVIQARRQGQPDVVGRVVAGLDLKTDTATLRGTAQLVDAARRALKRHPLVSTGIDEYQAVSASDSATLQFTVVAPYITRDAVDVPLFVQAKRSEWMRANREAALCDLLLATAMRERRQLRYVFVDDKGREIGTMLILPEEYEALQGSKVS